MAVRASELGSHREIVLRSILVEGSRLVLVERIVLERRVVQVLAVQAEREHVVQRVLQGGRQRPDVILRERRIAVQSAEERRPPRIRHAGTELLVLEVGAGAVRVLRRADQPIVAGGHERSLLAVGIRVVRLHADVIIERLLIGQLRTLHPALRIDGHRQQVRNALALRHLAAMCDVVAGRRPEAHVVVQVHVKEPGRQQRALCEVPLQPRIVIGRADRLEIRITTRARARSTRRRRRRQICVNPAIAE